MATTMEQPIIRITDKQAGEKKKQRPLLLNRYEVGDLLGQGQFAKVYLAKNVDTGEDVAIKVIEKDKVLKSGLNRHINREVAALRRARHPNVVFLHEVMATKSKIYFVMEYVSGGELFKYVSKGRLLEEVARKYFQQLISAVAFCHDRGVYHRDIKPENLLVDEKGNLKVCDFGLSALVEEVRHDGLFHTFCGTPAYVAPEVLARKGYNGARVDIWSCGVVLFALMAGYPPFNDTNINGLYRKIYHAQYRCPKWFSPDLIRFLRRLLDPNHESRITIPEIMENKWFKKGYKEVKFYISDNNRIFTIDDVDNDPVGDTPTAADTAGSETPTSEHSDSEYSTSPFSPFAPSLSRSNASGIRGSASSPALMEIGKTQGLAIPRATSLNAFDIISFSPGFDLSGMFEDQGEETRLISSAPVPTIVKMIQETAGPLGFAVRAKDCLVNLDAMKNGQYGALAIIVEIYELTLPLVVVEVKKKAGDKAAYQEFCNQKLKPALRSLTYEHEHEPAVGYKASDWE